MSRLMFVGRLRPAAPTGLLGIEGLAVGLFGANRRRSAGAAAAPWGDPA